ncbi:hypothetical protein Y717_32585 [Streptomyces scopuliridis RB72]|uniref:Uncharacterized protein n=1 Tax=Streptomyces scopuliridis RB72 TaxID=1440053 RepID=A0A2T7TBP9_9ACTN|nr:hypothetical protein Y717_32585 [Streptomyces scopuliridis RB72]
MAAVALLLVVGWVAMPAAPAGATSRPVPPTGIWRTDGYGTVLAADDGVLREYQTTAVGCLEGDPAHRTGGDNGSVRYANDDGDVFTLRSTGSRDRASMHVDGSAGDRTLLRIAALPDSCNRALRWSIRSTPSSSGWRSRRCSGPSAPITLARQAIIGSSPECGETTPSSRSRQLRASREKTCSCRVMVSNSR